MTEAETTPVALAWIGSDGPRTPLGEGRIGPDGTIVATAPAPGLAEWLEDALARLNARGELRVMEPAPGLPPEVHAVGHRTLLRGSAEFLDALPDWTRRTLAIALEFDAAAFDAHFGRLPSLDEGPEAAPPPDTLPPPRPDPLAGMDRYEAEAEDPEDDADDPEEDDDRPLQPLLMPER